MTTLTCVSFQVAQIISSRAGRVVGATIVSVYIHTETKKTVHQAARVAPDSLSASDSLEMRVQLEEVSTANAIPTLH